MTKEGEESSAPLPWSPRHHHCTSLSPPSASPLLSSLLPPSSCHHDNSSRGCRGSAHAAELRRQVLSGLLLAQRRLARWELRGERRHPQSYRRRRRRRRRIESHAFCSSSSPPPHLLLNTEYCVSAGDPLQQRSHGAPFGLHPVL